MRCVREPCAGVIAHRVRPRRHSLAFGLALVSAVIFGSAITFSAQVRRPSGRPAAPPSTRHPPFKAIFEPVSYSQDVELSDVFFIDAETGWACGHHQTEAGEGGVIIATRDGGRRWSVQSGDAHSATPACTRLFFVDASHGWATQADGRMLRTTDGLTWAPASEVGALNPFVFTSAEKGFVLDSRQNIQATVDGGRTWRPVYRCRSTIEGPSVAHEQDCRPAAIAFAPDHMTGYVVTRALENHGSAVIKTTDGGNTWALTSVIADTNGRDGSLAFVDSLTGYLRAGGALARTSDGAQTWHRVDAMVPDGDPAVLFFGSVGWMVRANDFSYTRDGGKRWSARKIDFPAEALQFSVPAPDTGYVVGRHGMVYRFRIVPFDYTMPHMLTIPAMDLFTPGAS